jgi:hypothetical protein
MVSPKECGAAQYALILTGGSTTAAMFISTPSARSVFPEHFIQRRRCVANRLFMLITVQSPVFASVISESSNVPTLVSGRPPQGHGRIRAPHRCNTSIFSRTPAPAPVHSSISRSPSESPNAA